MRFCKRCLYPEIHPLNLTLNEEGVCSGCLVHDEKNRLDWRKRGERLGKLLDVYRSKSKVGYDCIVPVSGARDSYFIVHVIKHVYKMHPLLVSYNKQYNTALGIRNLAYLRTLMDCDFVSSTVNPHTVKRITRVTLKKLGSMYWHCLAGETVFPVQVAVRYKIPLIVWGVHQGCDQVGMFSHLDEVEMTRKYRKEHDLMGTEAEDLVGYEDLTERDLAPFFYPHDEELSSVGVRGIYLGNYIRWDTIAQHEDMIRRYGYKTAAQRRTFDAYNDVDSFHYSGIHDYLKVLKHGYGKVTDHACREIRLKRLTREEGIRKVLQYTYKSPTDLELFLNWIGIEQSTFDALIEPHRNPLFWQKNEKDEWERVYAAPPISNDSGYDKGSSGKPKGCHFIHRPLRKSFDSKDGYVLIGKGYEP
jgi:N-acetyl sugar amidotransferase